MTQTPSTADSPANFTAKPPSRYGRLVILAIVALIVFALWRAFPGALTLENLAGQEQKLREQYAAQPLLFLSVAFVLYVVVTGLSLPGAAVLSLAYGWILGFWVALPLVSFASTTGATLAFLSSRYLLRDWVSQRYAKLSGWTEKAFADDGWVILLTLRLVPQVPFFVVNLLMGLTPISVRTYWWASQLGMLPATCVFLFAGASSPGLSQMAKEGIGTLVKPQLLFALALLGLLPVGLKLLLQRKPPKTPAP